MTSQTNVAWLQSNGRRYLIGANKRELQQLASELQNERDWKQVDWTPEQLWKTYIQLTEAEAAFRIHKTELSLRPIWHQRSDRVQAHILVCFLAYALWKTLEQWQIRAQLGNSPRTILDELGAIQSTVVILPLATKPEREMRLRCVVRPDRSQAMLLDRLGLQLPKRLRPQLP